MCNTHLGFSFSNYKNCNIYGVFVKFTKHLHLLYSYGMYSTHVSRGLQSIACLDIRMKHYRVKTNDFTNNVYCTYYKNYIRPNINILDFN